MSRSRALISPFLGFLSLIIFVNLTYSKEENLKFFLKGEIRISVLEEREEEDPVVATNGEHYMVVWQSNRKDPEDYDLWAERIRPDGTVMDASGFPVASAPVNQIFADIAWGRGQYLVAWQDLRSRKRWEIYASRLRPDGTVPDPEGIPVSANERNAQYPQVAWNGKNFLVVWMEEHPGTGWDVVGARVGPDGSVMDKERIRISNRSGDQDHPVVAWGRDHFLVVWADSSGPGRGRISGARIDASGKVLDPEGLTLSDPTAERPGYPAVAWAGNRFIVVWTDRFEDGTGTLSGVRVGPKGIVMDQDRFIPARSSNLHTFPAVACRKDGCLVVWEEDTSEGRPRKGITDIIRDVRGAWLDPSKTPVAHRDLMIAPGAVGNHFAKVASAGRNFLVVWKDYRTGRAASLGRVVRPPR